MRIKLQVYCLNLCLLFSLGLVSSTSYADEPFIGEVRWFAGNFAPRGWANCDGQLLAISQNTALFSLLGTTYGGDGRTTFGLPDLRGRAMVHEGRGPGLSDRRLGQRSGSETEVLTASQIPSHNHQLKANSSRGDSVLPNDRVLANTGRTRLYSAPGSDSMGVTSIASSGQGDAHENMQPFITLRCIIAIQGLYPSRS